MRQKGERIMGKITDAIILIEQSKLLIRQLVVGIANEILNLPENPAITRISDTIYTISSSDLMGNWSTTFHDFKFQYSCVVFAIINSPHPVEKLERILSTGKVEGENANGRHQREISLHPGVTANIRQLWDTVK